MCENENILEVRHLKQYFGKKDFKAVDDISFTVKKGEVVGIVGESGCGKTTTGRSIIKLYNATSGDVYFKGQRIVAGTRSYTDAIAEERKASRERIAALKKEGKKDEIKAEKDHLKVFTEEQKNLIKEAKNDHKNCVSLYRERLTKEINEEYDEKEKAAAGNSTKLDQLKKERQEKLKNASRENIVTRIQMIFQDPIASLDPRMTIREIIAEGLIIQGIRDQKYIDEKVYEVLEKVGLVKEHASRYPHEFSGGQRQRIGIARAIIMNPDLIIADEPVSTLDVSIQAQVINLLNELRKEMGLTILFIAHDLSVVKYFSNRIIVMYFGKIVEIADSDELFSHPLHPYTCSLLSAIPLPDPHYEKQRKRIVYVPEDEHDYSMEQPTLREIAPGHFVSCNTEEFEKYRKKLVNA
ncbi:ABC transporter ATP-binding protein [Blautia sp. HCP3S3_G3]|uniref:ABC transporter ATP-binding protein n=1 Tax=Blautia sp. HCP3S3_G3 TaxID=3438913 RepID=UPI003F8C900B